MTRATSRVRVILSARVARAAGHFFAQGCF